ncbi:MAG TPA: hypothetical protein VFF68_12805 [Anaerolineaceae bacterium]|nr:hypothetical protein [Anaerolineaceae bacterium]
MNDQRAKFLPFHAINEFMEDDYRQSVVQKVLSELGQLPGSDRAAIVNQVKKLVSVPGFRNSSVAPMPLKVKGAVSAFESKPEFTAAILFAWSELNQDLRQEIHALLAERDWELLPADADRKVLPGFLTTWPEADTFEVLDKAYRDAHADSQVSDDDVNLMIVWMSGRLPVELEGEEESETTE